MTARRGALSAPRLIAVSFAALLLIGGTLLSLPAAAAPGHDISLLDAIFTATSAICVTGLIVVDTPTAFSTVGQVVILLLIQIGGLGYMTRIHGVGLCDWPIRHAAGAPDAAGGAERRHWKGWCASRASVLKLTLAFELTGAAILAARWWPRVRAVGAVVGAVPCGVGVQQRRLLAVERQPDVDGAATSS